MRPMVGKVKGGGAGGNHVRAIPSNRRFAGPRPGTGLHHRGRDSDARQAAEPARCLESHIESGRRHGRAVEYAVIDDSPDPEMGRSNREMLRVLGERFAADVSYAGPEEKEQYVREMARRGLPEPVLRFGLLNPDGFPVTTGGSRNALLLHAAGELLLQVDDDTLCRMAPPPQTRPGLAFSSRPDPTEFWFPADECAAAADGDDLFSLHETLLGREPAGCAGCADATEAGAGFLRKLDRVGGRVLVTAAGLAGHSGMGSSLYFLSLEGESRARLLSSEETYRRALLQHRVVRTVVRPTVCDAAFCMAMNLGLDNRRPLPPFLPVQRGQDGVFGALVHASCDDGFFGFLPGGVVHAPPNGPLAPLPAGERGEGADDLWRGASGLRSGQVIQALLRSLPCPADLPTLGRTLAEWGALPSADFQELLRLRLGGPRGRLAAHLTALLQRHRGRPDYWADDVRRVLAGLREAAARKDDAIPTDLNACFGGEAAERFRRLVRRFGELLQWWPAVVEAARELRRRGVRPAVRA